MPYSMIDHTADVGIKVTAPTLKELFEEAAGALVDIIGARSGPGCRQAIEIETEGLDREDLLVRWLQEILFLVEVRGFRLDKAAVRDLSDTGIRAQVCGYYRDAPLESEIKAVTYHRLEIREVDKGFEVDIIFDI